MHHSHLASSPNSQSWRWPQPICPTQRCRLPDRPTGTILSPSLIQVHSGSTRAGGRRPGRHQRGCVSCTGGRAGWLAGTRAQAETQTDDGVRDARWSSAQPAVAVQSVTLNAERRSIGGFRVRAESLRRQSTLAVRFHHRLQLRDCISILLCHVSGFPGVGVQII